MDLQSNVNQRDMGDRLSQQKPERRDPHDKKQSRRLPLLCLTIVGGFYNLTLNGIFLNSLNVTYAQTIRIFGVSRRYASILITVFHISRAVVALVSKILFQKFGLGICLLAGGMIGCVGCLGAAFSGDVASFIAFLGVGTAVGSVILYLGTLISAPQLFMSEKRRGILTVLYLGGAGLGDTVGSLLMERLFENLGYRGTMIIIAGLFLQTCVGNMALWAFLRNKRSSLEQHSSTKLRHQLIVLLKNRLFIICLMGDFIRSIVSMTFRNIQVDSIITNGFSITTGAFVAFVCGVGALAGRIINGVVFMYKRWHGAYQYSFITLVLGGCVLQFALSKSYEALLAISCAIGLCIGALQNYFILFLHELVSPENYALSVTVQNTVFILGGLAMAPIAGWIRDTTGSYDTVFFSSLPLCGFTAVLVSGFYTLQKLRKTRSAEVTSTNVQSIYTVS